MTDPSTPPGDRPLPSVGRFLRRLVWRREAGPLSAEAAAEVRELTPEPGGEARPEPPVSSE